MGSPKALNTILSIVLVVVSATLSTQAFGQTSTALAYVYEGFLTDGTDQPICSEPTNSNYRAKVSVLAENDCKIHEEANLIITPQCPDGAFSLKFGNSDLVELFSQVNGGTQCKNQPTQTSSSLPRAFTISLSTDGGATYTLIGDQITFASVPLASHSDHATNADKIGGTPSASVVRLSSGDATPLTQSGFAELLSLIGGTSTKYLKSSTEISGLSESQIPTLTTSGKVSGGAINSGTIGGSTSISTTGNITSSGYVSSSSVSTRQLSLSSADNTAQATLVAPTTFTSYTLSLPTSKGANGQFLSSDGNGALIWSTPSGATNITALTGDVTASGTGSVAATVHSVGGSTATAVNTATVAVNTNATSASTASVLVKRDSSGYSNFKGLKIDGVNSGTLAHSVPATLESYTLTWPNAKATVNNQVLASDTSGNLSWLSLSSLAGQVTLSSQVTGVLSIANGGTNSSTSLSNNQLMYSNAGAIKELGAMSDGQVVVGKTGNPPQIVTMSGDVAITNTGATTVGKINGTTVSGVGLANNNLLQNTSGAAIGGNSVLVSNSTGTGVTSLSTPASGVLLSSGSVPSWSPLTNDNFTQYALLNGRAGGQELRGGNAANENLTLDSTGHATKGSVILNPSGGRVGIGTLTPNSTLHIEGSLSTKITSQTSNYIITEKDNVLTSGTTALSVDISFTLPTANGIAGRQYTIMKTEGSNKVVGIDPPAGQSISGMVPVVGQSAILLYQRGDFIAVISDGSNWQIVNSRGVIICPSTMVRIGVGRGAYCIEKTARNVTAINYAAASATCRAEGYRLCFFNEWATACNSSGTGWSSDSNYFEWIADPFLSENNNAGVISGQSNCFFSASASSNASSFLSKSIRFRCCQN